MKKIKTMFNFANQEDDKPARLELYGFVGANYWGDDEQSVTTKAVNDALANVEGDTVDVHINSYGGDAFEGIGIYNALKQSNKTINVYIDAVAASAASIIAMAGDTIFMPKNSQLMVHHALTNIYGNAEDLQKGIDMLKTMDNSLAQTYMTRFLGSQDELEELLTAETFLSADEALAMGLADEIIDYQNSEQAETTDDVKTRLVAKYSGKAQAKATDVQELKPEESHKKSFAEKLANLA